MKNITRILALSALLLCGCLTTNAQDNGKQLHSGEYHMTGIFEFMGNSSTIEYDVVVTVYENAVILLQPNGQLHSKYIYCGQSNDGGRRYQYYNTLNGSYEDSYIVYKNGTFYKTDGKTRFDKGFRSSSSSSSSNYNNNGYNNNSNNNSSNSSDGTLVGSYQALGLRDGANSRTDYFSVYKDSQGRYYVNLPSSSHNLMHSNTTSTYMGYNVSQYNYWFYDTYTRTYWYIRL